jgi:hypothetical protein
MPVVECEIPTASALESPFVKGAYFCDSYRAPLRRPHAGIVDVFLAIFGHHPLWMKVILIVRNRIASLCGLAAPTASEIMNPGIRCHYSVGESIGVWPIFLLTDAELIAGRNNRHLDFRLSVLWETDGDAASVVVSTVCVVHNVAGKIYLFFIVPFHRWGVRSLLSNAIRAGRL